MKNNIKQVIVIRKDLKMRRGKEIAQGCHAAMKAILDEGYYQLENEVGLPLLVVPMQPVVCEWLTGIFTKICVSVNSEDELLDVYQQAKESGLICSLIQDVGLTEFGGNATYTAVAVGPAESAAVDKITGELKLL